jgi:hypothetical protein
MGDVDHEQRYVRRIGHRRLLHVHKILQPPILLGITEVKLDLKAKAVILDSIKVYGVPSPQTNSSRGGVYAEL